MKVKVGSNCLSFQSLIVSEHLKLDKIESTELRLWRYVSMISEPKKRSIPLSPLQ